VRGPRPILLLSWLSARNLHKRVMLNPVCLSWNTGPLPRKMFASFLVTPSGHHWWRGKGALTPGSTRRWRLYHSVSIGAPDVRLPCVSFFLSLFFSDDIDLSLPSVFICPRKLGGRFTLIPFNLALICPLLCNGMLVLLAPLHNCVVTCWIT
jgi:hypothetical protein